MLGILLQRIFANRVITGIIILVFLLVGSVPFFIGIVNKPSGYFYPYLENNFSGGYHYLAVMNYAKNGPEWTAKQPYVFQSHRSSISQSLYVLLGKIAKVINIDVFSMFAFARFAGGVLMVFSVMLFFYEFLTPQLAKLATFLYLFSEPLPFWNGGAFFSQDYSDWLWHTGDALRRTATLPPHQTISKGLLFIAVLGTFRFSTNKKSNILVLFFSIILSIASGMIYPMPLYMIVVSISISLIVALLLQTVGIRLLYKRLVVAFISFNIVSLIPLLFLYVDIHKGWPWNLWVTAELAINDPSNQVEVKALLLFGPLIFLAPLIILKYIKKGCKSFLDVFLPLWSVSAFLLFPFVTLLKLSSVRLTEGMQLIPFIILIILSLKYLNGLSISHVGIRIRNGIYYGFVVLLFLNFFIFSSIILKKHLDSVFAKDLHIYVPSKQIEAVNFLANNAQKDSVVLALNDESVYIPSFVRVRTILGGPIVFIQNEIFVEEEYQAALVISGVASSDEAHTYLQNRNVRYVYVHIFTSVMYDLYPTLLTKIFDNEEYVIYEVKSSI